MTIRRPATSLLAWAMVLGVAACGGQPDASAMPSAQAHGSGRPGLSDIAPLTLYQPSAEKVAAAAPGEILGMIEMNAPAGMRAWTIVYDSTGLDGKPVAVSGMILAPAKPPAESGYPIVAWAHGTTGIADQCAPSRAGLNGIPAELRRLVEKGYVVTATDYEGLGTAGIHPYIVGISEGRSVLDSIVAARNLPDAHAGAQAVVIGHSQGGHAALWAAQLAPTYALGVDLIGAFAASPPTDLTAWERWAFGKAALGDIFAAVAPILLFGVWNDVYGLPLDFLTDNGRRAALDGREGCFPSEINSTPYRVDPAGLAGWSQRLADNSPGGVHTDVPIVVVSPDADQSVQYESQRDGALAMCGVGDTMEFRTVSGNHDASISPPDAWSAITAWISDRFAGVAPSSSCG